MRQIKFRIWHKKENRWFDPWAEEDPILSLKDFGKGCEVYLYDRNTQEHSNINCQMDDVVIQQYTGLKDKNGVEIYEGDLLTQRSFKTIYLVDFNNENYGYVMGWNLLDYGYFKDGIFSECEKVEYSNSNTVNYPVSKYYYGKCPTNNEIDGLDPYYEVVGNIFEGVDK